MGLLREAQGRGLMEREKEGELTADAWRTQRERNGGRRWGEWERKRREEKEKWEEEEEEEGNWERKGGEMLAELEKQRGDGEGWSMAGSGETNGPAWRDSSQSIMFKQKQQAQENI